jgi:Fe-S-cluster-containing dehydrogenase component
MHFNQEKNVAGKCNLCFSRVDYGLQPSCVQHCIGGALQFLDVERAEEIARGRHRTGTEKVWYISTKWELSLFGKSCKKL